MAVELLTRRGWRDALRVLNRLEAAVAAGDKAAVLRATASAYERVMVTAAKDGDTDTASRLLATLKAHHVPVSPQAHNAILYGYAQSGQLARARHLFQGMQASKRPPNLINYNTMLLALAKQGQFEEAKELLAGMPKPDIVSFNTTLAAGATTGSWKATLAFFREREKTALKPDLVSYNTLLSTLQRLSAAAPETDNWRTALALVEELQVRGLRPDAQTFNTLLDVGWKSGKVEEAAAVVLPAMRQAGITPDRVTYNTLAFGYAEAHRYADALAMVREVMPREGLGVDMHSNRIAFMALAGLHRDAELEDLFWQTVHKTKKERQAASSTAESDVQEQLLHGMTLVGRVEDGLKLLRALEQRLGKNGRPALKGRLSASAVQRAIQVCKSTGDLDGALALLRDMERRGLPRSLAVFDPVIRLCSLQKALLKGLEVVQMLQQSSAGRVDRSLHNTKLSYFSQLGDVYGCRQALDDMRQAGLKPEASSYVWALRCEIQEPNNWTGIREMLARARDDGVPMTQDLAKARLKALKKLREWRGAVLLLDSLAAKRRHALRGDNGGSDGSGPSVEITSHMFNDVLASLVQAEEWDRLLSLQARMEDEYGTKPDCVTYFYRLMGLGQTGKWEEALALFERIRAGALGPNIWAQEQMYTCLMTACARWGRLEQTRRLLAMREEDGIPNSRLSINSLISAYGRSGQLAQAIETFEALPTYLGGKLPDVVAFNAIIMGHRLHKTPLDKGCMPLYRRLLALGPEEVMPDASTYTGMLASCEFEGLWPVSMYLYDESAFTMATAATAMRKGGEEAESDDLTQETVEGGWLGVDDVGDSRFQILKTLIASLDRFGVHLFAQDLYNDAYRKGVLNHWLNLAGQGRVMDFHDFSRPLAKAAIHCALEEFVVEEERQLRLPPSQRREHWACWAIIVGQGHNSAAGVPVLKKEVERFLRELDPPLRATVQRNNPGRLLVGATQVQAYVKAQLDKKGKGKRMGEKKKMK